MSQVPSDDHLKVLAAREPARIEAVTDMTQLLRAAVDKNIGVDAMEKLVALHERMTDRQAASEFAGAMAEFQAECPPINKTSTAKIVTKSGASFGYTYAELDEIAKVVRPILHRHGLSYSWDSDLTDDGRLICKCTARHVNGHSETSTFKCPIDTDARMSEPQKHAAALTYAKRQSLCMVLGLTTTDADNDGAGDRDIETIGPGQTKIIESLIDDSDADLDRFLRFAKVERVEDILTGDPYEAAISLLQDKLRNKQAKETA